MDNLVRVDLENSNETKSKNNVLLNFEKKFLKSELSKKKTNGKLEVIVDSSDTLEFKGYFITRNDLIQLLSDVSGDIEFPNKLNLKDFLSIFVKDNPPFDASKIGVGVRFGIGASAQQGGGNTPIVNEKQELQLVIDAFSATKTGKNPIKLVSCYTTANLDTTSPPTTIPSGGTKYPS